jgi:hypothetical protein
VPSQVVDKIQEYTRENATDGLKYSPTNLIITRSGEWLLIGYSPGDQGSGTYDSSANFPSDVLAAANNLPDHTGDDRHKRA